SSNLSGRANKSKTYARASNIKWGIFVALRLHPKSRCRMAFQRDVSHTLLLLSVSPTPANEIESVIAS
ncbi:MAG TPA: hypothetical protein VII34_12520, partial [Pyrinomonadaceae bacterium]